MERDISTIVRKIKDKNITAYEIAKYTDLTEVGINKILNGSSKNPRKHTLNTLHNYLENRNSYVTNEPSSTYASPLVSQSEGVPYYDVDFIGGFDLVINNTTVRPSFFINFQPFNDADYWVNVTGKSMSPFISHGDIIALKKIESWNDFLLMGEIYAVVTPEFRTVKILAKGENKDNYTLVPYSKDPVFSPQQIPKRLISHIFKVKGSIKKFF